MARVPGRPGGLASVSGGWVWVYLLGVGGGGGDWAMDVECGAREGPSALFRHHGVPIPAFLADVQKRIQVRPDKAVHEKGVWRLGSRGGGQRAREQRSGRLLTPSHA
jgi:hypothetical protein